MKLEKQTIRILSYILAAFALASAVIFFLPLGRITLGRGWIAFTEGLLAMADSEEFSDIRLVNTSNYTALNAAGWLTLAFPVVIGIVSVVGHDHKQKGFIAAVLAGLHLDFVVYLNIMLMFFYETKFENQKPTTVDMKMGIILCVILVTMIVIGLVLFTAKEQKGPQKE